MPFVSRILPGPSCHSRCPSPGTCLPDQQALVLWPAFLSRLPGDRQRGASSQSWEGKAARDLVLSASADVGVPPSGDTQGISVASDYAWAVKGTWLSSHICSAEDERPPALRWGGVGILLSQGCLALRIQFVWRSGKAKKELLENPAPLWTTKIHREELCLCQDWRKFFQLSIKRDDLFITPCRG